MKHIQKSFSGHTEVMMSQPYLDWKIEDIRPGMSHNFFILTIDLMLDG